MSSQEGEAERGCRSGVPDGAPVALHDRPVAHQGSQSLQTEGYLAELRRRCGWPRGGQPGLSRNGLSRNGLNHNGFGRSGGAFEESLRGGRGRVRRLAFDNTPFEGWSSRRLQGICPDKQAKTRFVPRRSTTRPSNNSPPSANPMRMSRRCTGHCACNIQHRAISQPRFYASMGDKGMEEVVAIRYGRRRKGAAPSEGRARAEDRLMCRVGEPRGVSVESWGGEGDQLRRSPKGNHMFGGVRLENTRL